MFRAWRSSNGFIIPVKIRRRGCQDFCINGVGLLTPLFSAIPFIYLMDFVVAFSAAIMLMEISGRFVATYTLPVLSSHLDSIFSFVGIAVMFMVIMVATTWTIFGLISQLSSQVFQWIGQAHHDLGENKGESAFMGAMVSSKGAVHAMGSAAIQPGEKPKPPKDEEGEGGGEGGGGGGTPPAFGRIKQVVGNGDQRDT